jgi:outer membrane protein assembly factor BamB
MKQFLVLSIFFSALGFYSCADKANADQKVVQWRGTDRSGIYQETGLLQMWAEDGPQLLWHYDGLGEGHSSPAIANNKIFINGLTDSIGFIYSFDMNGNLLNKKEYGPEWRENFNGSRGTITPNDGKLYLISGMGAIYCFDENTLDILWQKNFLEEYDARNIAWGISESPLIVGDKVIATPGGKEYNVIAFDKNSGELVWSTPGEGSQSAYCSPLLISDQEIPLIVQMTGDFTLGINADTGQMLWSHPNINQYKVHANTPVYGDNMILCTSGYGRGSTMLRLTHGGRSVEEVWFNEKLDNRMGGMVKIGDYVYGSGDFNRNWYCADWKTGEIVWESPVSSEENKLALGVTIANSDGMLYCYTQRGEMALVKASPEKFNIVSQFMITLGTAEHWAHPALYDGVLYVRHGDTLMAYNVKPTNKK